MATVTSRTAASIDELLGHNVISGLVADNGHLILTTKDGAEIDAGVVVPEVPYLVSDETANSCAVAVAEACNSKAYATKVSGTTDMVLTDGGSALVLPKSGMWMVTAHTRWDSQGTAGRRWMGYHLDDVLQPSSSFCFARTGETSSMGVTWLVSAVAGQTLRIKVSQTPDEFTDVLGYLYHFKVRWLGE